MDDNVDDSGLTKEQIRVKKMEQFVNKMKKQEIEKQVQDRKKN